MTVEDPLITCICITHNRIAKLKKAVNCFKTQDYPNKELLVSYPRNDKLTAYVLSRIIASNKFRIVIVERENDLSLGEARNQAVEHSNGHYICTWDDDDWYHPNRLTCQFYYLKESENHFKASILNQLILFDRKTDLAYISFLYPWENTLLCHREVFKEYHYSSKNRGEDSNIIDVLNATKQLLHIGGFPFLYIYIYHDENTWGYFHFKSFIKRSELLNKELTDHIAALVK